MQGAATTSRAQGEYCREGQTQNVDLPGQDLAVACWTLEGFVVPSQAGAG